MKSWHDTDSQKFHSLIQAESHPEKHVLMRSNFDNQVWELFWNQNPCHILWPSPLGLPHCDGQRPAIILPCFPRKASRVSLRCTLGFLDGCVWGSTLTRQMWKKKHILAFADEWCDLWSTRRRCLIVYFLKGPQRQICPWHTSTISDDWVYNPGY